MSDSNTAPISTQRTPQPFRSAENSEKTRVIQRDTISLETLFDGVWNVQTRGHGLDGEQGEDLLSPVVGWLVVTEGPGKGRYVSLGFGRNEIGRSASNRVVLDFGDEDILRRSHASITYDARGRRFYFEPGPQALHLTSVSQQSASGHILTPANLRGGEVIILGQTHLKFVPFCGPDFSWD